MSLLDQLKNYQPPEFVQGALKRTSKSGDWYYHTDFAKDKYGRLICTIDGNPIKLKFKIVSQEGKTDEEIFRELCYEHLVQMYNKSRRMGIKVFDDITATIQDLNRDSTAYTLLNLQLTQLQQALCGELYYSNHEAVSEILEQIKILEPEVERYRLMIARQR